MRRFTDIGTVRTVRSAIATLALVVSGCTVAHTVQPEVPRQLAEEPAPSPISLTLHVDDAFSQEERNLIEAAVVSLNVQTHGLVTVRTVSGMDTASFWIPPGEWRLLRIGGDDALTLRFDMRNAKGRPEPIVGICVRADHSLYLVPDRIRTERMLISVAMHEILHAVGAEHRDDPPRPLQGNVMSPMVRWDAPVVLSATDLLELRRSLSPILP